MQGNIEAMNRIWGRARPEHRVALLKAIQAKEEWKRMRNLNEMRARGGGIIASKLASLMTEWQKKNPRRMI